MDIFTKIAERRIKDAMENGLFENLKGAGMPLSLEDETWIPEDLRVAYRVLKNAGFVPPELEMRNEIISLRELINTMDDDTDRIKKIRELNFKILKLNMSRETPFYLEELPEYERKIIDKWVS